MPPLRLFAVLFSLQASGLGAAALPNLIVDQFGWRTGSAKVAILAQPQTGTGSPSSFAPGASFEIRRVSDNGVAASGSVSTWNAGATHSQSGDKGWWADFSSLTATGRYYLSLPGGSNPGAQSYPFDLREDAYAAALKASVRAFYYQRCGTAIDAAHGGSWTHGVCHTQELSAHLYDGADLGSPRDVTGGWHDAGDYRKYVSFTFSPLWDLMQAYDFNPCAFPDNTGIPESGNGVPDILDEVKWELDWLLKMQRPDGALYSGAFVTAGGSNSGSGDPSTENTVYYYANYSSAATSTGAMAFAKAARLFQPYGAAYPGYAAALQAAAVNAWTWLQAHPANVTYNQTNFTNANANVAADEDFRRRVAASAELFRTTGGAAYQAYFDANYNAAAGADNGGTYHPITNNEFWPGAASSLEMGLVTYCLAPGATAGVVNAIKTALANGARNRVWNDLNAGTDLYRGYMWDGYYGWGSNMGKSHWGAMAVWAARLGCGTALDQAHDWTAAEEYAHYIHGRNPLNWVYLTNMGPEGVNSGASQSVNSIYHGWFFQGTVYDGFAGGHIGPAPGILAGGANGNYINDVASSGGTPAYPPAGQPLMKSFRNWGISWPDCSWTVTEPGIYYQAAYVFLASSYAPCSGPQPTATPTPSHTPFAGSPTFTATLTPSPSVTATPTPVCQTLLNGAETLAENGTWSGPYAVRSIVAAGAAPAGAVTQGSNALYANITVVAGWDDSFANLAGFSPANWAPYTQLKMDVHVAASLVTGATYSELLLRADCATCGAGLWYQPISLDTPSLVAGPQTVTWNLNFAAGTLPAGSPISKLTLVLNDNGTAPLGAFYIDNIRLVGPCGAPSPTPTHTPTATLTRTPSPAMTATPSASPSSSATPTASPSSSSTVSPSPTASASPLQTPTSSATLTGSPSPLPSKTATPTLSRTLTLTATSSASPSASPSLVPTKTATPSATQSPTFSASPTDTPYAGSPTDTATVTMTPSDSPTSTETLMPTLSATPTATPSFTETVSISPTPSLTATVSVSDTPSLTATVSASGTPSLTATVSASGTPSLTASVSISGTPTPGPSSPTSTPTLSPTVTTSFTGSVTPSSTRTPSLTSSPAPSATPSPSVTPLAGSPTVTATSTPTVIPGASSLPDGSGPLVIDEAIAWPNPDPDALAVKVQGACDRLELRLYTPALTLVLLASGPGGSAGWIHWALPSGWQAGLAPGVYYAQVRAYRGAVKSQPALAKMLLLR